MRHTEKKNPISAARVHSRASKFIHEEGLERKKRVPASADEFRAEVPSHRGIKLTSYIPCNLNASCATPISLGADPSNLR